MTGEADNRLGQHHGGAVAEADRRGTGVDVEHSQVRVWTFNARGAAAPACFRLPAAVSCGPVPGASCSPACFRLPAGTPTMSVAVRNQGHFGGLNWPTVRLRDATRYGMPATCRRGHRLDGDEPRPPSLLQRGPRCLSHCQQGKFKGANWRL